MTLDLDDLVAGWECAEGELGARVIPAADGGEVLQLRVDVGVLQMSLDGRPDGERYHGLPTVHEYVLRELRVGGDLTEDDWQELHRELNQFNYRRLALSVLIEETLHGDDAPTGSPHLKRALRDIDHCLLIIRAGEQRGAEAGEGHAALVPTLIFNRVRLLARLRIIDGRHDEAIDEIEAGIRALEHALGQTGTDEEQCEQDAGIAYLQQMSDRLRRQHKIKRTLREQLDEAIEAEDFEAATRLRDRLRERGAQGERELLPPPTEHEPTADTPENS